MIKFGTKLFRFTCRSICEQISSKGSFSLKLDLIKLKQTDFLTRKILNSHTQEYIKILETSSQL